MALALAGAAALKPEIRLDQALHDYEAILTDEERVQLRSQGVPTANDAINLTTLIDKKTKDNRRHCMGPRLITFLESVQQFSSIVDIFVSSNPQMAALVWGGVRFALLTANNVSSYFNKLSTLFMDLGRTCPRFREFGLLYVSSTRLQKALCDYYAGIVRLCRHSTQLYRKSISTWLLKTLVYPFESEFGPYQRELEQLSKDIQAEISLASAQAQKQESDLQQKERKAARASRKMLTSLSRSVQQNDEEAKNWALDASRREMEKARTKALDAFSVYDHQRTYKQLRKECVPGTSSWICETDGFQDWMKGLGKTFWCTGKLGSGKSIMSACVAAYIMNAVPSKISTGFFFCRHDDHMSLKARTILGSIAKQLATSIPPESFRGFSAENADSEAMISFLHAALTERRHYFIVLDGLDECEEAQVQEISQALSSLLHSSRLQVKIYFSGRPYVVKWLTERLHPEYHITLETEENQAKIALDIDSLIKTTLTQQLEGNTPELRVGDPTLILTVQETLQEKAQGMFLWVKLQLDDLCDQKSDEQILAVLDNLPQDLPQTFGRVLRRYAKRNDFDVGRQIFRWAAVSKRPLTVAELREALATEPLQKDWKAERQMNDMKKAVACCGNLIFVDEEEQTVHFTHSSVKQYLLSDALDESLQAYKIDLEEANADIGAVCVTYLSFNVFNTQVAPKAIDRIDVAKIPSTVLAKALPLSESANKIALRLLRGHDKSIQTTHQVLAEVSGNSGAPKSRNVVDQFPFRQYAKQYWLAHTKWINPTSTELREMWHKLLDEAGWQDTLAGVPWAFEDWEHRASDVVDWTLKENHFELARYIIEFGKTTTAVKLIKYAAYRGSERLIKTIASASVTLDLKIIICLASAARDGQLLVVERYLKMVFKPNALCPALVAAARGGHVRVMDCLLWELEQLEIGVHQYEDDYMLALRVAAEWGHKAVVDRLLSETTSDNIGRARRYTLEAAAAAGQSSVVEKILQRGGEIEIFGERLAGLKSPLVSAAAQGHMDIVGHFLRHDGYVSAIDERGPALEVANRNGRKEVAARLQAAGLTDHTRFRNSGFCWPRY